MKPLKEIHPDGVPIALVQALYEAANELYKAKEGEEDWELLERALSNINGSSRGCQ